MMGRNIIVIGAGAAGLMAAKELSSAGNEVTVIEASGRPGGRIRTFEGEGFPGPTEAGAEFIHGSLPVTLSLLDAAGIGYTPVIGRMVNVRKGRWGGDDIFGDDWELLMQEIGRLTEDVSLQEFLDNKFGAARYELLRTGVRAFAEGYDLADIRRASTLALYHEWQEEEEIEYRVDGGYNRLVDHLVDQSEGRGAKFLYNDAVTRIDWSAAMVGVQLASGRWLSADHVILTASLGVLQRKPAVIGFSPGVPAYQHAIDTLGFGTVIKVLMEFETAFWEPEASGVGFLLSDEEVPTWWLQASERDRLVTGWLAGEARSRFRQLDGSERAGSCIRSIAHIFGRDELFVRSQLTTMRIDDWTEAPYVWGGYSYETVGGEAARAFLRRPLDGRIWFAGEALYEGPSLATVEAALTSGRDTAQKINALR